MEKLEQWFKGKVALISGGASGLGRCTTQLFAQRGARICVLDPDVSKGRQLQEELKGEHSDCLFLDCDVTQEHQVQEAIQKAVKRFGKIDVVHSNAGILGRKAFIENLSLEDWNRMISINLTGMFLVAKHAIVEMKRTGGGSIVFTGSNWAYVCEPGFSCYAASKGGVVAFARALAIDHAKDKIRINVICPGNMNTPMTDRYLKDAAEAGEPVQTMGQLSEPEEVARTVVFVASPLASALIGSAVVVDHGETIQYGYGLNAT